MSFTFCTKEDFANVQIGQELKINARYEDLKRENGENFHYVARKNDVVVVCSKKEHYLVVRFYEDVIELQSNGREHYGLFVVHPLNIQKII